jgi:hypothetical protein
MFVKVIIKKIVRTEKVAVIQTPTTIRTSIHINRNCARKWGGGWVNLISDEDVLQPTCRAE